MASAQLAKNCNKNLEKSKCAKSFGWRRQSKYLWALVAECYTWFTKWLLISIPFNASIILERTCQWSVTLVLKNMKKNQLPGCLKQRPSERFLNKSTRYGLSTDCSARKNSRTNKQEELRTRISLIVQRTRNNGLQRKNQNSWIKRKWFLVIPWIW